MAPPIIDSLTATPDVVAPGASFVVVITAHDPDSRSGVLRGIVTDAAGGQADATITVLISDPLTFDLSDVDVVGFQITPRPGSPGVFDCVAPV